MSEAYPAYRPSQIPRCKSKQVTAVRLREPVSRAQVVPLAEADAPLVKNPKRMDEIDMSQHEFHRVLRVAAQAELQVISQSMLQSVRNKDVGPAGDSLRGIVTTIRGFSVSELDVRRERTWWEKLLGRAAPLPSSRQSSSKSKARLTESQRACLTTSTRCSKTSNRSTCSMKRHCDFYDELALYIAAGEEKLLCSTKKTSRARSQSRESARERQGHARARTARSARRA